MITPRTITPDEEIKMIRLLARFSVHLDDNAVPCGPCGNSLTEFKKTRNILAFLLMLDAGLRVGEAVQVTRRMCYFELHPVKVLDLPSSICKGKEPRAVPVSDRLAATLLIFNAHPLLIPDWPGSQKLLARYPQGPGITTRSIGRLIANASETAIGRPITPHTLRHTFATKIMRLTNTPTVQALMGHKHLSSTQVYQHPDTEDLKNAIDGLNVRSPGVS